MDADYDEYTPSLSRVLDKALGGAGGARGISFNEVSNDLAKVTLELPFVLPPYFALIIRAIGVLEGIAITGDQDFVIIDEAYPYIAKRLLTDDNEQVKTALTELIYDKEGELKVDRIIELLESFEIYAKLNNAASS